jgi:hypothetical protein
VILIHCRVSSAGIVLPRLSRNWNITVVTLVDVTPFSTNVASLPGLKLVSPITDTTFNVMLLPLDRIAVAVTELKFMIFFHVFTTLTTNVTGIYSVVN